MKRLPSLNALRAFQVAAQLGSFTKAGEALFVTQGAISRQVKVLEETLGRPLFFRVHQGIRLTDAGELLAKRLQQAFDAVQEAVDRLHADQTRQQIAINIPPTFATRWLAPRLTDFCSRYPYVDLQITTNWVQSLRDAQGLDCLVVFDQQPWPRTDCEKLMVERHVMVGSPRLWRDDAPPEPGGQTLLHILNGRERLPVWERWIDAHPSLHVDPRPGLAFSTLDQAINAALSGAGVAIVDEAMIRPELAAASLRRLNDSHIDGPYGYWFIDLAREGEHKAVARLFREWLREQAQASSASGARLV